MSTKEAVIIVCRALSIYFLAWLLADLTYLPSYIHSFWRHEGGLTAFSTTYWRDSDILSLSFLLLRIGILFFGVQWFYQAGPTVQRYFLASTDDD